MRTLALWGSALAGVLATGILILAPGGGVAADETAANSCAPYGKMKLICGLKNPEDLMPIPGTKWIISSGMSGQGTSGHFYLVDGVAKTFEILFPGDDPKLKWNQEMFPNCPGPLDLTKFSVHGLSLRAEGEAGHYKMYITSHGAREAVEAFDLDASGDKPALTWVGCVTLPEKTFSNSVAILPDGGFVVTKFMDPTVPNAFAGIMQGKVTGVVFEWHPGDAEVKPIPGTELSGPNGIEVSPDGKTMYVAVSGAQQVNEYALGDEPRLLGSAKLDIRPDNIRWGPSGKLWAAGGVAMAPAQGGPAGWQVVAINPETMEANTLVVMDGKSPIPTISVGVRADGAVWVGSFSGDKIGYVEMK